MIHDERTCVAAREQLSARLDGERTDEAALDAHLARCPACRAHQRALAALQRDFALLREPTPLADLWPHIERGARPPRAAPTLARLAAGVIGFVSLGGAALWLEQSSPPRAPSHHILDTLAPDATSPSALFASLPEYRVLRALPTNEESR